MRFVISCGGTGGHLSPGIALAEGLAARGHSAVLLISRKRVDGRLIAKYPDLRIERAPGAPFSWHPLRLLECLGSQCRAVAFCLRILRREKPDVTVGFGGFTCAPLVVASRLAAVPAAIHESNRIPGLATRALGRWASRVYLPPGVRIRGVGAALTRQLGLPVRQEIKRLPRAEARSALGLDPAQKVLSVLGGSQGAAALNDWAREQAAALAAEGVQLYCLTGLGKGEPEIREHRSRSGAVVRSVFVPFSDQMAELLSASDLTVSRAGAGTLAELIRCETPAILVPFPHAADDHQRSNARFFERQGGGLMVDPERIGSLYSEVVDTIFNEWLLRKFRGNLRRMDRANSLPLMIQDLELLGGASPSPRPPAFAVA